MHTLTEPYPLDVQDQLLDLKVDHAIAALMQGDRVVGYTMCHSAGPKHSPFRCQCLQGDAVYARTFNLDLPGPSGYKENQP